MSSNADPASVFTCNSHLISNIAVSSVFYGGRNRGSESLSNLPEVTQPRSRETNLPSQARLLTPSTPGQGRRWRDGTWPSGGMGWLDFK